MANVVIRLNNVSKFYDQTCAVDSVSFSVRQGEFLVLLGGSGCGKTTTLRLVAGLERPETGEIWVNEVLVANQQTWIPPEKRQIGMVFQDYALFPHLTVAQNIAFALNDLKRAERSQRIGDLLALVGLEGKGERYPHQLSGGQQQRVALARALAPSPLVVLLDEPFSNLDAALRKAMREEVRMIVNQANAAAIFVTHDQEEAMRLADQIGIMQGGRMLQIGKPDALYRYPVTPQIAKFLGEANFMPGEARGEGVETALGMLPLAQPAYGHVNVMIRPETLRLSLLGAESNKTLATGRIGTVIESHYFGHYRTLKVQHSSGLILEARVWAHDALNVGDQVDVQVQGEVIAFRGN